MTALRSRSSLLYSGPLLMHAQATALAIWTDFGTTALDGLSTAANSTLARHNRAQQLPDNLGRRDAKNSSCNGSRRALCAKDAFAENRRNAIFHALPFLRTLKPTASFRVSSGTQRNL